MSAGIVTLPSPTLRAGSPALESTTDLCRAAALIDAFDPRGDEVAAAAKLRTLRFVAEHPDALLRTCQPGHLTGSALVVDHACERTLLLYHRKLQRWLQPGGHADGDGNLVAVALREATEETGIDEGLEIFATPVDVDVHRVAPPGEPPHLHFDLRFVVRAPAGAFARGNHESTGLRWCEPAELPSVGADASTIRLAKRGFAVARRVFA